jgi:hypothetical protein
MVNRKTENGNNYLPGKPSGAKEINMVRTIKSDLFLEAERMLHTASNHTELSEAFVTAIDKVDKLYGNWGFKAWDGLSNQQIVEVILISCETTIPGFRPIEEE